MRRVRRRVVETQHDIGYAARAIGREEADDRRPVVGNVRAQPTAVVERVQADRASVRGLAEAGVHSRDDLADLATDELTEITGQSAEDATALIMKAREHWFAAGQA